MSEIKAKDIINMLNMFNCTIGNRKLTLDDIIALHKADNFIKAHESVFARAVKAEAEVEKLKDFVTIIEY
jgi:hypothetical protein